MRRFLSLVVFIIFFINSSCGIFPSKNTNIPNKKSPVFTKNTIITTPDKELDRGGIITKPDDELDRGKILSSIGFSIKSSNYSNSTSNDQEKSLVDINQSKDGGVELYFGQSKKDSSIPKEIVDSEDFNDAIFKSFQSKILFNKDLELTKPINSFLYLVTLEQKSYIFAVKKEDIVNKSYTLNLNGLNFGTNVSVELLPITGKISIENNIQSFRPEIKKESIKKINFTVGANIDPVFMNVALPTSFPIQKKNINPCPIYCKDDSTFIFDVSYPDNTIVKPNTPITKVWAIQNSSVDGVVWKNRKLKKVLDEVGGLDNKVTNLNDFYLKTKPDEDIINIPTTYPGQIILLEENFITPNNSVPVVRSTFKMFDEFDNLTFPCLYGLYVQLAVYDMKNIKSKLFNDYFDVSSPEDSPSIKTVPTGTKNIKKVWKIKNISKEKFSNLKLKNINEAILPKIPNLLPINSESNDAIMEQFTNIGYLKPKDKIINIPDILPNQEIFLTVEVDAPKIPANDIRSSWKIIDSTGNFMFDDVDDLYFSITTNQLDNSQTDFSCISK